MNIIKIITKDKTLLFNCFHISYSHDMFHATHNCDIKASIKINNEKEENQMKELWNNNLSSDKSKYRFNISTNYHQFYNCFITFLEIDTNISGYKEIGISCDYYVNKPFKQIREDRINDVLN